MQISPITQNMNYQKTAPNFCRENKSQNSNKNKIILYSSLGVITAATVGIILYKKSKKENLSEIITHNFQEFYQSLSKKEHEEFDKIYNKLDFSKIDELKGLDISHETDKFKRILAISKMKTKRSAELPQFITTNLPQDKISGISNLLKKECKFEMKELTYESPEKLYEFINNLKNSKNKTSVTIKNPKEFFDSYKNNKEFQTKFDETIKSDLNNKVIFLTTPPEGDLIDKFYKIFLKFV